VLNEMVISITQERFIDDNQIFRGGCTLILDLETQGLRYCIKKPLFDDQRLERQKNYTREILGRSLYSTYLGLYERTYQKEPFALLHGRYT
jgi:hypothetical protein